MAFHIEGGWQRVAELDQGLCNDLQPHIQPDGTILSLPPALIERLQQWVQRGKEAKRQARRAAKDAELPDLLKGFEQQRRNYDAHQKEKAEFEAALARIAQYADERGLVKDPANGVAILDWCERHATISEAGVDAAVKALTPKLIWVNPLLRR